MKANKHVIDSKTIEKYILAFVFIVVFFQIVANLYPTMVTSGATLNASGLPLGELFTSGGAIWYLLAVAIVILVYKSFQQSGK